MKRMLIHALGYITVQFFVVIAMLMALQLAFMYDFSTATRLTIVSVTAIVFTALWAIIGSILWMFTPTMTDRSIHNSLIEVALSSMITLGMSFLIGIDWLAACAVYGAGFLLSIIGYWIGYKTVSLAKRRMRENPMNMTA